MNFENWLDCQREEWNVSMSIVTQNISIMEQADNGTLNFSYLEAEIFEHIKKYDGGKRG